MKPKRKSFKLNVPARLLQVIRQEAERDGRSVTAQINRMLEQHVATRNIVQEADNGAACGKS